MKDGNVIEVKSVKKKFKVFYDKGNSLKEKILFKKRNHYEERWVLNEISFDIKKGESVGLIGKNGCGKSTTLKLLTRILYPTEGYIEIKGRISSLLELGAGFHPDMSGRENIYTNASIFGLTRKEIDERLEDIIEFSELREFIDNPVRTYSSGMYMRLAFSVAINVDADILLIDEILAVGDINFQKKCFEKLKEIKKNGKTIIIVSHSFDQIENICNKVIWIDGGKIKEIGNPRVVTAHYYQEMENIRLKKYMIKETKQNMIPIKKECNDLFYGKDAIRVGNGKIQFTNIKFIDHFGNDSLIFVPNGYMKIQLQCLEEQILDKVNVSVSIFRDDDIWCFGSNTFSEKGYNFNSKQLKNISLEFKELPLYEGKYYINIGLYDENFMEYDQIIRAKSFYVKSLYSGKEYGLMYIKHEWKICNEEEKDNGNKF